MVIDHKTLNYQGKVIFEKLVLGPFRRAPKPSNEDEACFMYLQEGSFQFRTPEKVLSLNTGDAVLAKCSHYFFEQTTADHQKSPRSKGIGVYLYPSIVKELFDFDLSLSDFETNYDATNVNTDALMKNFIDGIEFLLDNPSVCSESMLKVKLKEFILMLAKTENAVPIADFISSLFKPYQYDFKKVVQQNIFSELLVGELAQLCGMSISTFQRTFSEVFGQTPSAYILEQRMSRAKDLLRNPDTRISEVAYQCGYQSSSTFNRLFKKEVGTSPSEFRLNEIGQ